MRIMTRDFGEIEIDKGEIIQFAQPIFGFESLHNYVMLHDDSVDSCFGWLQSIEDSDLCFIVVDPQVLPEPYSPTLSADVAATLALSSVSDAMLRVIAVIPEDFMASTANLKSPIAINVENHCAVQVMLDEDYPIRAPLVAVGEGARG